MSNDRPFSGRLRAMRVRPTALSVAGAAVLAALLLVTATGVRLAAEPSATPRWDWLLDGLVNGTTRIGNTLYAGGTFTTAAPSSGALSRFFQLSPTTGAALPGSPEVNGGVRAIAPDGAGGYYIAGTFTNIGTAGPTFRGGPSPQRTAHVLANGSVDAVFQPQYGGEVAGMLRVGPSLVVFGRLFIDGGTSARALLAVNPVTGALSPWVPAIPGYVGHVTAANGVLYVLTWDAAQVRRVSAFEVTTGAALWTSAALPSTSTLAQGGDGIVVAGSRVVVGLDRLYSLDPGTGVIDAAWGGPAGASGTWTTALAVSGSTIYVAGRFSPFHGQARANLAAVDASTGAVLPWNPQASAEFSHMGVSSSGSVFVAADEALLVHRVNGEARRAAVFEIDASGMVTPWESQALFRVSAFHVASTSTPVFGALYVPTTGTATRAALAGFDTTTGALLPNTPTLTNAGFRPSVGALASLGPTLFMSGAFDTVNGQPRVNLAAVDTATNTVLPWPAAGVPAATAIVLAHGDWVYAYDGAIGTISSLRRVHAQTGVLDPAFALPRAPAGQNLPFAVDHGQLYIGTFTPVVGAQGWRLSIHVIDALTDTLRFLSSAPASITGTFAVDGDTVYLADPARTSSDVVGTIRAYDLRTSYPVSAPPVTGQLNGVAVADGRLFVSGGTFAVGATTRGGLAEIARPGAVTPWDSGSWFLESGFNLSFRGVTDVVARGDLLVAHGQTVSHIRLAGFSLSGASAPAGLRSQLTGPNTTFTWDAMVPPPTGGYVIEGGFKAGQTAGALPVGNATSVTLPMPAGPVFIRVRPQGSTEVSNEIVAGCVAPPLPPTALTTTLVGTTLTLAWTAPAAAVTNYTLLAGTAAGLSNVVTLPLGSQTSVSGTVPGGTFFARVTASNACGTSGPSGEVFFTIGAPDPLPAAPTNLAASVSGSTVSLTWTAPAGAVTSYVLEVGTGAGLANLGTLAIGATPSLVIPGVPAGTYVLRVRAITSAGSGAPSADVVVVVP